MLNTLNVSITGLNAAKIAVENVSNNIANENTPGYKRRVVQLDELSQTDSRFTGRGVNASSTYRITSQYMYDKLMAENTKTNYYEKLSNMLGNVESLFAETEDSGLSSDINRYFQAIENLRSNPNSEVYRSTLKTQASLLVDSIKNIYSSIEKQQVNEREEFSVNVDKVNGILKEIGSINEKIAAYSGVNNDLLDKRDMLESELSNYVNISVDRREGFYELKISGQTVISNSTNVRQLNIIEENTPQVDKFNHIKYNSDNTFQIYDSMKYKKVDDSTYTPRNFFKDDVVTYKLNNQFEISVKIGEVIPDISKPKDPLTNNYPPLDINGDGNFEVTEDELVRALVYKINTNSDMKESITAYNGDYVVDENGNKVTDDKQDNFLRIESVLDGLKNNFDGRIYVEEKQRFSTYEPQAGDVVVFKNVVTDSELYKALQDGTKFTNNGDGTFTAKAGVGEIKILEDESVQKKFVGGEIVLSSTLETDSEMYKALQDPTKFVDNGNGTFTATANAGLITLGLNQSISIDTPKSLTYTNNEIIDTNSTTINVGSQLETDLNDPLKFTPLGGGFFKAITTGSVNLELNESVKVLKTATLNVSVTNIPAGSIVTPANLVVGSPLHTLLNDVTKFTDNGNGTFTINITNGSVPQNDFILSGNENISIKLSQEVALANNFSYTPPSTYDSNMISNVTLDGTSVNWDSTNGVLKTNPANDLIGLTGQAVLSFNVTGTQAGNRVDLKAGDIIEIVNEDATNGVSMSEQLLESDSYFPIGNGKYQLKKDKTLVFDDAADEIKVTKNVGPTTIDVKQQDGPGNILVERKAITSGIDFDESMTTGKILKNPVDRNEEESRDAESTLAIGVFGNEINLRSGTLKAQLENLSSTSESNKYQDYLDKLDSLAKTLSDISDKYIKKSDGSYVYGEIASEKVDGSADSLGLFSGASVKTLKFNEDSIKNLNQSKLEYLSTIQWKNNLSFDSLRDDASQGTSLREFYRDLKVNVALGNENVNFLKDTQNNVKQSIQSSYDQLTKVDKDEEMLNLIKFQAAYTANAKIITAIDEMLNTLLGLKR